MHHLILSIDEPQESQKRQVFVSHLPFRLGRAPDNDLCLPFASISGRHLSIDRRDDGAFIITDLGSTNGTRVHNQPLSAHQPHLLHLPCSLRLGDIDVDISPPDFADEGFTCAQSGTELREMVEDVVRKNTLDDDSWPFFEILSGPDTGRRFVVIPGDGPAVVGTSTEADIALRLTGLPPRLAHIEWDKSRCWLVPSGSEIYFAGAALSQRHRLSSGDRFVVGPMEILFYDPLEDDLVSMEAKKDRPSDTNPAPASESTPDDFEEIAAPAGEPDSPETPAVPAPARELGPASSANKPTEKAASGKFSAIEIVLLAMSVLFLIATVALLIFFFTG